MCENNCAICKTKLNPGDEIYRLDGNDICYNDTCLKKAMPKYNEIYKLIDDESFEDKSIVTEYFGENIEIYLECFDDEFFYTTLED